MRFRAACVAGLLSLIATDASHAVVRIANDRGGEIERYMYRYDKLRASRQSVMIDGLCASACTIVLSAVAPSHICVTPRAILAFHAAWISARAVALSRTAELLGCYTRCILHRYRDGSIVGEASLLEPFSFKASSWKECIGGAGESFRQLWELSVRIWIGVPSERM